MIKKTISTILILLLIVIAVFLAYSYAPDIPHDDLAAKYTNETSNFITADANTRIHTRLQGNLDAPTLVLLHGSNSSLQTWEPWVKHLKDHYRIITLDLPGHGLTGRTSADAYDYPSMVTAVDLVMAAYGVQSFYLGGNSMGGGISIAYAIENPEKVKALILIDAAGITDKASDADNIDRPLAFEIAAKPWASGFIETFTPRSIVRQGLEKSFSDQTLITEDMVDLYYDLARHPGNRRATAMRFQAYSAAPHALSLEKITAPTLILWGDEDKLIPVSSGREMHERIKGSVYIEYQGVGHIPMEEIPVQTAKDVHEFLQNLLNENYSQMR